ncbi:MAG TPA: GNAT family N-acetyltransferase [Rudaea sp.]|jgi:acetyltransferase
MKASHNGIRGAKVTRFQAVGGRPPPRDARLQPVPSLTGELIKTRDGGTLLLRHIRRDDVDALRRGFATLTPDEIRLRFLHPLTDLPAPMARQFCDIDTEHALAIVLVDPRDEAEPTIRAVARAYIDPATLAAEFALIVQHDFAGQGLGALLMQRLIGACRQRGAVELWGDVLNENGAMLELCGHLGFSRQPAFHDPGVTRVQLSL